MRLRMGRTGIAVASLCIASAAWAQDTAPPGGAPVASGSPTMTFNAPPSGAVKDRGIVAEVHLGTSVAVFSLGNNANENFSLGVINGGVYGGYKLDRFIFGLGFDIQRFAVDTSTSTGNTNTDTSSATTSILFSPGVRIAILRSSDERVELYGEGDFLVGHIFGEPTPMGATSTSNYQIGYRIGPGVRYWVHPSFSLGFVALLQGYFTSSSSTTIQGGVQATVTDTSGVTSIGAQLQALAVF